MTKRSVLVVAVVLSGCTAEPGDSAPVWSLARSPSVAYETGRVVLPDVAVSLSAWGAEGALGRAAVVEPVSEGRRTLYVRPGLVEWWEPTVFGLEHGFTVSRPPANDELVLDLRLDGATAEIDADGRSATWTTDAGAELRYQALLAWDEEGTDLPARMEATDRGLRLVVDTTGAVGTVTVDPLLPGAAWQVESNQILAALGLSVAGAGDVNGDGYDDLLAGAPLYDDGQSDEGAAFLALGSAAGPGGLAWAGLSNQAGAMFGFSVASAGDVNGDGFDDVVVGAPFYTGGQNGEGAAFVYFGSAGGLAAAPAWTAQSDQPFAKFGFSVASAGDVNGDGFDDLVVGAPSYDGAQVDEGAAFLYLGSAAGLGAAPVWSVRSSQASAQLGNTVAGAGDVDGDGYDDVVVGASKYDAAGVDEGAALLYRGSAAGLDSVAGWASSSGQARAMYGTAVASAGDTNGDGYDDVVVGAKAYDGAQLDGGAAFLYLGSAAGLQVAPVWTAEGAAQSWFGQTVASAGDLDADGYADLVVGAPRYGPAISHEGAVYVYLGSPTGPRTNPSVSMTSGTSSTYYGISVASAGDVNGDGHDDLAVGAHAYNDGETDEGAAILYFGR